MRTSAAVLHYRCTTAAVHRCSASPLLKGEAVAALGVATGVSAAPTRKAERLNQPDHVTREVTCSRAASAHHEPVMMFDCSASTASLDSCVSPVRIGFNTPRFALDVQWFCHEGFCHDPKNRVFRGAQ